LAISRSRAAAVICGTLPSGGSMTSDVRFCPSICTYELPRSIQKLL
jgi:hypothetical protein